jgi:hypothetical protein
MPRFKQFQIAPQDLQDIVEVVCHAARQFAQRFHLLRLDQLALRLLKQFGCAPSLGDVACDFRESNHLSIFVDGRRSRRARKTGYRHAARAALRPRRTAGLYARHSAHSWLISKPRRAQHRMDLRCGFRRSFRPRRQTSGFVDLRLSRLRRG